MKRLTTDNINRKEAAAVLLKDMQATAARMRELIVYMPAHDLLGYIYAQPLMTVIENRSTRDKNYEADGPDDLMGDNQFLLEYVHAVLASDTPLRDAKFDQTRCVELFKLVRKLRGQAMFFAMVTSADTVDGAFGPATAE